MERLAGKMNDWNQFIIERGISKAKQLQLLKEFVRGECLIPEMLIHAKIKTISGILKFCVISGLELHLSSWAEACAQDWAEGRL